MTTFTKRVEELLGAAVTVKVPISGGDFASAFRIELSNGRIIFGKTHADAAPDFFETEALGLTWLAEGSPELIPNVLGVHDDPPLLLMEWIDIGSRTATADELFGHALASLHRSGAATFGRTDRRPTGSRQLPNDPCATWVEFYRDCRLLPLADDVERNNALPHELIASIRHVADQLDRLNVPVESPARLHGDLWAGNRLVGHSGRNWLIDPAAHGGHREFDLAMMRLFGGFGPEAFAAYHESFPLEPGWEQRIHIHQLAPLIVHAIKFGGGYVQATQDALDKINAQAT